MTAVIIFITLAVLLVAGKILRVQMPVFQKLYLPSSVVGGLIGLFVISSCGECIPVEVTSGMRSIPGFLINVIFATLLIAKPAKSKVKKTSAGVFPQLVLAQIVVWGQYVVGVGLAGLLLSPLFGVENAFGNLLELGFEGGHGTVGGMSAAFKAHSWEDGIALGYTVATIGMIGGIVIGMGMVNWAYRRGFVKSVRPFSKRTLSERRGIHSTEERPSAGKQTVLPDSIDSLAWHIAIVGLAVLIGFGILQCLKAVEIALSPNFSTRLFNGFPMFPLCMLGGVILRKGADLCKINLLVDNGQMKRISGAALDFLAVSAVATIQLDVVAANWMPLTIMVVAGFLWTASSVLFFSRRIFSDSWFERAIAEFGQATGVTATGLLLLRTVDPDSKTAAAQGFAGKQLIHEPFTNLWVAMAFALVMTVGWVVVFTISLVVLAIWCFFAWRIANKLKSRLAAALLVVLTVGFSGCASKSRPIGVFDSGIGGMTVLEKMLTMDLYDNATHERTSDGIPDFANESFLYFGDQANMPYGDYAAAGKSEYLKKLIVEDADFLLSKKAKAVVIACNTATAWGLESVSARTEKEGVSTVGVIGAGVSSALSLPAIRDAVGSVSIGVMATPGTIASGAYERTIAQEAAKHGIKAQVKVFVQGCAGLADAVEAGNPRAGEIAAENFRALMAKHAADRDAGPMKAVILGCTHYPFVLSSLEKEAKGMVFVDPALATAELCYLNLLEKKILSEQGGMKLSAYISVPAKGLNRKFLDENGNLTRACKYGRDVSDTACWTDIKPYEAAQAGENTFIRQSLGAVWKLLND